MPATPARLENPRHLSQDLVRVERALKARAEALEQQSASTDGGNELYLFVAAEFRTLAEEMHHW